MITIARTESYLLTLEFGQYTIEFEESMNSTICKTNVFFNKKETFKKRKNNYKSAMTNKSKNPQTPILFDDVEKGNKYLRQPDNEVYGRSSNISSYHCWRDFYETFLCCNFSCADFFKFICCCNTRQVFFMTIHQIHQKLA